MRPIQSIIMFMGGSGGDFLKMICCRQLYPEFSFTLTSAGMIDFKTHYFKTISEKFFNDNNHYGKFDYSLVYAVDNSHHYLDSYTDIANNLFFIDYPDSIVDSIVNIYREKRHGHNSELFFNQHYNSLPENIKKYITKENINQALNTMWIKQQKIWRDDSRLTPIQLADFFDKSKLKTVCETLINTTIRDQQLFDNDVADWAAKNQKLAKLFT